MGWIGAKTVVQQTTPQIPQWIQAGVQSGMARAQQVADRPYTPFTGERVAGLAPAQQQAIAAATSGAGQWRAPLAQAQAWTQAAAAQPAGRVRAPTVTAPGQTRVATAQAPGAIDIDTVDGRRAAPFMTDYTNPWLAQVEGSALDAIRRSTDQGHARLGTELAGAGAFGGSREAIMRAELEREAMRASGDASAQIRADGFNAALQAAGADAARAQDASAFNSSAASAAREAAAGRAMQGSFFNASALNAAREAAAARGMTAGLANAGAHLDAQKTNASAREAQAGRMLAAGEQMAQMANDGARLNAADASLMAALGGLEQDVNQTRLDAGYQEFEREQRYPIEMLAAYMAGVDPSALSMWRGETSKSKSNDPYQALGSLGSLFQGAGALLRSDARLKTDIVALGADERGQRWYQYRYSTDAPSVQRLGVMAQEAPARAVHTGADGMLLVDYGAL